MFPSILIHPFLELQALGHMLSERKKGEAMHMLELGEWFCHYQFKLCVL